MAFSTRIRDLMKKYGKVAVDVHLSISTASIASLYVAINNNVDVDSLLHRFSLSSPSDDVDQNPNPKPNADPATVILEGVDSVPTKLRNWTAELAASSGGAFMLAVLCNKALFPVRAPITIALTPPIARFLARRNLIKN